MSVAANSSPSPATGRITSSAQILPNWDTTRPILRFDFPTAQDQEAFHRAFLQVRSEKDKATFMARFFDNYDSQVSIPRRVVMDTSRDEQVAKEVQRSLGVVMDTDRDLEVARRLQQQMDGDDIDGNRMNAQLYDGQMASLRQRRLDFERRRQGYGGTGGLGYNGGVGRMVDRFTDMSVHQRVAHPGYPPQQPRQPNYYNNSYGEPWAYGPGDGGYGNGSYDAGYDPRYRNWGQWRRGY
ncbi:unnamed protein product [Alternaria burnsii]|nr:unnamed protein product [Alternaria burnsii]